MDILTLENECGVLPEELMLPPTETPRLSDSRYIPTLDGWRAVAISFVVFAHSWTWLGLGTDKIARLLHYPEIAVHLERFGATGVEIFFCISGFLITRRLLDDGLKLKSFYIRRAFRILPPAIVYLIFVSVLGALDLIAVGRREILGSLFFYRNYLDVHAWFTGHFWSLSIEEQFYLFWPSVLFFAGIKRSRMLAILGVIGIVVWRQVNWPLQDFALVHTGMRLDAILCGSVMALFWSRLKPLIQKAPPSAMLAALLGFGAADLWSAQLQSSYILIQVVLVCLLIGSTVATPARLTSYWLELAPVAWVGRLSYSIYLWQQLFLFPAGDPRWQLLTRWLCIISAAWLSYTFVERPLIATGRRMIGRSPAAAGDSST